MMSKVVFKISAKNIRQAVKERVEGPIIALTKNPDIRRLIAEKAVDIVTLYVPKKTGALRNSVHITQTAKDTKIIWGGEEVNYAEYQYTADDWLWNRTTPGTKSYWTEEIEPGSDGFNELIDFATPLMKKEVRRDSK